MELLQMTAAYSNAVMMLVMSNATDVATKLDQPMIKPVQAAQVWRFVCDPRKDAIGGWLTLTNGYEFWFNHGYVDGMESSHSYFSLQDPDLIAGFYGTIRMSETEVVQLARQSVRKLGYNPPWLQGQPLVEAAKTVPRDKPKVVPHYRVQWEGGTSNGLSERVEVEVNADAKRVEKFWLSGPTFWREQPKIPQPAALPKVAAVAASGGQRLAALSENENKAALEEICGKATEMATRLRLPIKRPIRTRDVKESDTGRLQNDLKGQIILGGGWRFNYEHGRVISFHAPESESHIGMHETWTNMPPVDSRKFFGEVKYTKKQVEEFATQQVRQLGYHDADVWLDQPPLVYGGPEKADPRYARFFVRWQARGTKSWGDPDAQGILAEVDGTTLELKSLWLRKVEPASGISPR